MKFFTHAVTVITVKMPESGGLPAAVNTHEGLSCNPTFLQAQHW